MNDVRTSDRLLQLKEYPQAHLWTPGPHGHAVSDHNIHGSPEVPAERLQSIITEQLWMQIGRIHPLHVPATKTDDALQMCIVPVLQL